MMHKPIHERYHYGNDRREQDMTESEFLAWFDAELFHHSVQAYVGTYPHGADVSFRRGTDSAELILDYLKSEGRLEYGWSTFTINEEG